MSDLEIIGMRDDATGELYIASILGTLGTMFAVVIYRNDAGLRWIHEMVSSRTQPDPQSLLEGMDCLKVEWCRKGELLKSDLQTLNAAGFKPKGKGAVWPRFESCRPGWFPWGMTDAEARLVTELLSRIARFIRLREVSGPLHEEPLEARVPIISPGDETSLRVEEIEWLPFVPPPAPTPIPFALSGVAQESLRRLPVRDDFTAEMMVPLAPELSFVDEKSGRPCIARAGFIIDRDSQFILCMRLEHGAVALGEAAGPALIEALRKAKARPVAFHVDDERLAIVLRPACEAIGVPVSIVPLEVAPSAWQECEGFFRDQHPP
jgi:hypothetical protein